MLSTDPAKADYPMGYGNTKPSSSWFKLGFPSGYVSDVLQNLEVLSDLGLANDPRLDPAIAWLVGHADHDGRWANRYAYHGKTGFDVFSHHKSVLRKPARPDVKLLYPPYKGIVEKIVRRVLR